MRCIRSQLRRSCKPSAFHLSSTPGGIDSQLAKFLKDTRVLEGSQCILLALRWNISHLHMI